MDVDPEAGLLCHAGVLRGPPHQFPPWLYYFPSHPQCSRGAFLHLLANARYFSPFDGSHSSHKSAGPDVDWSWYWLSLPRWPEQGSGDCGLIGRNLCSGNSGGQRSEVKVSAGLVSPQASLTGLEMLFFFFSQCLQGSPLCRVCVLSPLFIRSSIAWVEGPPRWLHFNLLASVKALSPNTITF